MLVTLIVVCKSAGPPELRDNLVVKLEENKVNVTIDIRQHSAFPEPTNVIWIKNGQPSLRSGLTTTYSNVTFDSVMRSDAGNYAVTATNFWLDDSNRVLGTGTGSFSLDVLCMSIILLVYTYIHVTVYRPGKHPLNYIHAA